MVVDVWQYLANNPGWWTLVAFGLYVVWTKRDALFGLVAKRAEVAEKRAEMQGNERWALIEQLIATNEKQLGDMHRLFEKEWEARRLADDRVIQSAQNEQRAAVQSLEIMQEFADIARMMVSRQDDHDERMLVVLQNNTEINNAIGFVLAQLYFGEKGGRTFRDLVVEMRHGGE